MVLAVFLAALITSAGAAQRPDAPRPLRVSDNKRFLVTDDGRPFFWLGDTAWELFHRLTREDAIRYLNNRAGLRFTVIQAVALAEFDGLNTPNAYGHRPLVNNDPATPDVKDGPANDYWDFVDVVVEEARARGLYIGLLPTWGDKWNRQKGVGPEIFTPANAEVYGAWLGRRYRDAANIVWILGGDRAIDNDTHRAIVTNMARGLRAGDEGRHLITFHPRGNGTSAVYFHDEPWLDFNMRQNGHGPDYTARYEGTRTDYDRVPIKPVLDGEPIYEDHPVSFNAPNQGHSISSDVRRAAYWDLFSGAFGHTYGHHSVWQFYTPERTPVNSPLLVWTDAITQPGAVQLQHARALLESRPFLSRIPDDDLIVPAAPPTSVPGAGRYRFVATRDQAGSYAMIYAPVGRPFTVRMTKMSGAKVIAWWFNPRTGQSTRIGTFDNAGTRAFTPPDPGEALDWVLVLDDASRKYGVPGARK